VIQPLSANLVLLLRKDVLVAHSASLAVSASNAHLVFTAICWAPALIPTFTTNLLPRPYAPTPDRAGALLGSARFSPRWPGSTSDNQLLRAASAPACDMDDRVACRAGDAVW